MSLKYFVKWYDNDIIYFSCYVSEIIMQNFDQLID